MDGDRLDAIARQVGVARTRRGAPRAALALVIGIAASVLARPADDAAARRHACQVRCGADSRLCRADCTIKSGVSEKQCKRTCIAWRERCFEHCEFKPLAKRTVPHDRGTAEFRRRATSGPNGGRSGVFRRG